MKTSWKIFNFDEWLILSENSWNTLGDENVPTKHPVGSNLLSFYDHLEHSDDGNNFFSGYPLVLLVSYVNTSSLSSQPSVIGCEWTISGVSVHISFCKIPFYISPLNDPQYSWILDVIVNDDVNLVTNDRLNGTNEDIGTFLTGINVSISENDGQYFLNTKKVSVDQVPFTSTSLHGYELGIGPQNELLIHDSGYTMDDIEINSQTNQKDIVQLTFGNMPLSCGRVGNSYYLIISEI